MIDPARVVFFIPGHLKAFKLDMFNRVAAGIERDNGLVVRGDFDALWAASEHRTPIVGCTPELRPLIDEWIIEKRKFLYFDRGYARRVLATWLPRGESGGYYRWHANSYQMKQIRDVPDDRWKALKTGVAPWRKDGRHIVIAAPTPTYSKFHALKDWLDVTVDTLSRVTDRQLVVRGKETKRPLQADLQDAHALVAHASIAAVEAVICGCPAFVHPDSAAALVGLTDLKQIERPIYPERTPWLRSLAFSQFSETEMTDGTVWKLME